MCSGTPQDYSGIGLCTPKMGMLCRINNVFHYNHSTRMVLMYLDGGIAYVTLRMILWFCQRHTPPFARNPHSSTRTMTTMSFGAMLNRVHPVQASPLWLRRAHAGLRRLWNSRVEHAKGISRRGGWFRFRSSWKVANVASFSLRV